MTRQNVVRGYGPLDVFLAKQRHKIAKNKIKSANKTGRILDVGCGNYPLFLLNVNFSEKYGLDKISHNKPDENIIKQKITLIDCNFEEVEKLKSEKLTSDDRKEIEYREKFAKIWLKKYAPENSP